MLQLKLENLKSVTTDGAKNMVDSKSGAVGRFNTEMECSNADRPMQLHCSHYAAKSCVGNLL